MAWPFHYKTLHHKSDSIDQFEFLAWWLSNKKTPLEETSKQPTHWPWLDVAQIRAPKHEPLDADELVLALEDQAGFPGSHSDFIWFHLEMYQVYHGLSGCFCRRCIYVIYIDIFLGDFGGSSYVPSTPTWNNMHNLHVSTYCRSRRSSIYPTSEMKGNRRSRRVESPVCSKFWSPPSTP